MTCCRFADDELLEGADAEQFDCDQCEVAAQEAALDADNRLAWRTYQATCNRFLVDVQAADIPLQRTTAAMDTEDTIALCERLRVIYDIVQPPKKG